MIDLTPLDVRQKKADFPRGLRGYDPGHVEDFLNLVADRLEALVKENRRLAEEVATLRSSAGEYKDREKALTEALVSAQQMREEVREQSAKEADLLRREAVQDARRLRNDALIAIEKEEETLRRLRARQRQLVEGYRGMLERELRELAVVAESLDAADSDSGREVPARPASRKAAGGERPASHRALVAPAVADAPAREPEDVAADAAEPSRGVRDAEAEGAGEAGERPAAAATAPAEEREASSQEEDPWALPSPAAARPPATGERGRGGDRLTAPAASHGRPAPRGEARDERREDGPAHRTGEEPDWLAAILKEE